MINERIIQDLHHRKNPNQIQNHPLHRIPPLNPVKLPKNGRTQ